MAKRKSLLPMEVIPTNLQTPAFLEIWEQWKEYKRQMRKKFVALTAAMQLRQLSGVGPDAAVKMIEQSITQGWQGLFPVAEDVSSDSENAAIHARLARKIAEAKAEEAREAANAQE